MLMPRISIEALILLAVLGTAYFFVFSRLISAPWEYKSPAVATAAGNNENDPLYTPADYQQFHRPMRGQIVSSIPQPASSASSSLSHPASPPPASSLPPSTLPAFYSLRTPAAWQTHLTRTPTSGATSLAPLTARTQALVHAHQHTANCSTARFVVMRAFPSDTAFGLGALVASLSHNLGLALQNGRVLVLDDQKRPGAHFFDAGGRGWEELFLPVGGCTMEDVRARQERVERGEEVEEKPGDATVYLPVDRAGVDEVFWRPGMNAVPDVFGDMLDEEGLWTGDGSEAAVMRRYWWRSQSAAYLLRPNAATLSRLSAARSHSAPLPAGCWSVHVRHGDKAIEMALVPFSTYVKAAEKYMQAHSPLSHRRCAFLSTEDPSVLADAAADTSWQWLWSHDLPRINAGPEDQLKAAEEKDGTGKGRTALTEMWLLELLRAVEADAWVGTRGSGWCRLIDALRCTWVDRCDRPFLEVGDEDSWRSFGW